MAYNAVTFLSAKYNNTAGQNTASSFLSESHLTSITEQRQAAAEAADNASKNNGGFIGGIGYSLEKLGLGFLSSIEGIWDYTAGGLAKLFGADDWAEQQFANDWVNYNHADEWFNPSDGWKFVGDVTGGIGTSLPAIAATVAAGAIAVASGGTLTPVAAALISATVAGLGAAGNATKEAYRQTGQLTGKEFGYGALVGVTEGAVEGLSAGIGVGTGQIVKGISKSFGKEVAASAARQTLGKTMIKGFIGEAFEEGLSEILDPVWARLTYDPNAKNATIQEVGYAALVGGLSGAIMGGVDVSVRNVRSMSRGNTLVNQGKSGDVISMSQQLSEFETNNHTGYEQFELVQNTLNELQESIKKTNGEIKTAKQKMLLGVLEQANTTAAFTPFIARSAETIVNNAEVIAEKLTSYGYKDASGNPIVFTAEQIRSGVDVNNPASFANALKDNSILRTLAVTDATGQLSMDTAKFKEATLRGEQLSSQVDLNRFIETATDAEKGAVAEKLGIADWNSLTNEEFHSKISEFVYNGGVEAYQQERAGVESLQSLDADSAKALPRSINMKKDGAVRYSLGERSVAVVKKGESYQIYDYTSGKLSKTLTKAEVNKTFAEIRKAQAAASETVVQTEQQTQTEASRQTQEIDSYARENISDYAKLNDANQNLIRGVIRQGRAAGLSDADVLSYARVSAHTGINVVFDKELCLVARNKETGEGYYSDGYYDPDTNRFVINPETKRTHEALLLHELTHAIYKTADGKLILEKGVKNMSAAEKEAIIKRYRDAGHGGAIELMDEINAHYAEGTLTNKNILEKLIADKPTFKDKVLQFFKKSKADYTADAKLSKTAQSLYNRYKKLFDSFSERNQQYNAAEYNHTVKSEETRQALPESLERLEKYSDEEIKKIETSKLFQVARSYEDVREFISRSKQGTIEKRLFLGKITAETAAKIQTETGLEVAGKSIALSSSDIKHIFKNHGIDGNESARGQVPITEANFENIIETLVAPDTTERSDENGNIGIVFKKNIDGKVSAVTIMSEKRKALTLKSAWIQKEKQSTSLTPNVQALSLTSETGQRLKTVLTDSIAENSENVNTKSKKSKNKRYALQVGNDTVQVDIEETKNLVALHNLSEEKLLKVLQLGGFPMPSIAVTKVDLSHTDYGDITVVFGKDTISPTDRRNKVYQRDAWTPTMPQVDVKFDTKEFVAMQKAMYGQAGDVEAYKHDINNFFDEFHNYNGEYYISESDFDSERIAKRASRYAGVMAAYLSEKGVSVEPVYKERKFMHGDFTTAEILAIADKAGVTTENVQEVGDAWNKRNAEQTAQYQKVIDELKKAYVENYTKRGIDEQTANEIVSDNELSSFWQFMDAIRNAFRNSSTQEYNARATEDALYARITDKSDFEKWLFDKISATEETRGIANGRDPFTASGSRRSFMQLHDAYNIQNIVANMLRGEQHGSTFFGHNANSIAARLSDEFTSIKGIKEASHLLTEITESEYDALMEKTFDMSSEIVDEIDTRKNRNSATDAMTRREDILDMIAECASVRPLTPERILSAWNRQYNGYDLGYKFDINTAQKVADWFAVLKQLPTKYFEAKPRRVVEFSEIKTVLIPESASEKLKTRLKNRGVPYQVYGAGENARTDVLQTLDGVRFALPAVEPVKPTNGKWTPTIDTFEAKRRFPNLWDVQQDVSETRNPTQIRGTVTTYRKIYNYLREDGFSGEILDASSGLGYGTRAGIDEYGFKVEDIEPYPDKSYKPKYTDYSKLTKKYDAIISNAVLNVLPQDQRDALVIKMGELLNDGGTLFVNVRGDDVNNLSSNSRNVNISNMEWYVDSTGSYQKGFTRPELIAYLQDALGKGYSVEPATFFGKTAAIVRKLGAGARFALPNTDANGKTLSTQQLDYFRDSKILDDNGHLLPVYHGSNEYGEITVFKKGKTGYLGGGIYLTTSRQYAERYANKNGYEGRIYEAYLNVTNPLTVTTVEPAREILRAAYGSERVYNNRTANQGSAMHLITSSDIAKLRTKGYDGIVWDYGGSKEISVFDSSQIKLITNQNPTQSRDIRYALPDDDNNRRGGLTRGQRAKFVANNTQMRVYSKAEAADIINSIIDERLVFGDKYGSLSGKSRAQVIETLFRKLNSTKEGYRIGVALNIADYIIENAVITDMFDSRDTSYSMEVLSGMRKYMHGVNLNGIKGEIQYRFDKKNSINLVWGAKQGGISPDVMVQELSENYGLQFEAINEADQFFEMLEKYEAAKNEVNERVEKVKLTAYGSEAQIGKLRQQIARDILNAYDEKGSQSKYGKLVEKYTRQIESLTEQVRNSRKINSVTNNVIDSAQYLRDIAAKRKYVGAEVFQAPELTSWLKQLGKLKYRSDLRKTGARQILLDYGKFYNTNNPLLYDADPNLTYIDENVLDALAFIQQNADSKKPLSLDELKAAQVIMASAKHLFQNYDQMTMEGKKVRISEIAAEGNEILLRSKNRTGGGFFNSIYGVMNKIVEPRVVIKSLENYNPNGVLTRAYNEVTRGETAAGALYIDLVSGVDEFFKTHKKYSKRLASERITIAGAELTVGQAISLYELSKREQAREGLYESGFSYLDQKGAKRSVSITESDISTLEKAFTAEDKGFIAVVEEFFNQRSKQVKTDADLEILGYTNTSEDFYFPIKRDSGTIAKNITDARELMADWANVYNFSFNKDVKAGAKNKIFVTDVFSVITRHAKQLSTYAKLTVPLKNFSQIYSKNIGDKTHVKSIRNTLNEQVWSGADRYLSKLFSDIQGRATSNSVIEKLRGAYAKYQLGANLKVIVSQITSYPTAGIQLDMSSMTKGAVMKTDYAAMDKYCEYARVRNYEKGVVKAEGVIDKVGKIGDILTKPIQWTDRATIGKLWNACQVQVQKDSGLKIGTVENMQKAGVMLEEVVRLTQPNYSNTERSELMRSDSDIVRSFTMFTSVPLKQLSRLVESVGEFNALRQMVKSGNADADVRSRYNAAKKKLRRTLASITVANLMYVMVGQMFKWLYNKDRKDKDGNGISFVQDFFTDFASTTIGMFPVVKDIYNYFANDYEFNNFAYETVNSLLSASKELFELATKAGSGEPMETSDYMKPLRNSIYAIGQITGLPFRNINNTITGLVKRFSPSAAYKYNSMFCNGQYSKDIKAALEKGDTELADTIMGLLLDEDKAGNLNDAARKKLIELYEKEYTVLPRSVGDSVTYNGETIKLTAKQRDQFKTIYGQANKYIEKMIASGAFMRLSEEKQAKAIKQLYDAYYDKALAATLGVAENSKMLTVSKFVQPDTLSTAIAGMSDFVSDKDASGKTVQNSKKKKVLQYLMKLNLSDGQRLLLLYYAGYSIKDGEYRGWTAERARTVLLRYILNTRGATTKEKAAVAEMCDFQVRNGKIVSSSVKVLNK